TDSTNTPASTRKNKRINARLSPRGATASYASGSCARVVPWEARPASRRCAMEEWGPWIRPGAVGGSYHVCAAPSLGWPCSDIL
ncbi:MAG: hypothetical protein ACKOPS_03885, partial [Cyanobium sp.]